MAMKKYFLLFSGFLLAATFIFSFSKRDTKEERENRTEPYEYFLRQRMYPDNVFAEATFKNNLLAVQQTLNSNSRSAGFNAAWTMQGPGNIGGRINCVAVHPLDTNIIFAGSAQGGIFKTTDGGANWHPVFDGQSFLSLSWIEFNPVHPDTMFAGTGDRNMTRYTYSGNGLYRSTDGGETWSSFALQQQGVISKIVINPQNTNEMYAACMGSPFVRDSLRGVYKTNNGGQTWNRILIGSDEAGCTDIVMSKQHPDTLYAATWNSIRSNHENVNSGNDSKLWKTTNGGTTWTIVPATFNQEPNGRISLALSEQNGNKLYACVVDTFKNLKGIFKTTNGGNSWTALDVSSFGNDLYGSGGYWFGWYFGLIKVNPWNDEQVFVGGIDLWGSLNGGSFWQEFSPPWWTYEVHADKHDLRFTDSTTFLLATDGGLYKTADLGTTYSDIENIPNTQFYRVAYAPTYPDLYFGGAQDNGSNGGNANTINDWIRMYGGDGFRMIFHPTDSLTFYCETQWGAMVYTEDGGMNYNDFTTGIDIFNDRINWDFPYIMSPTNPAKMYCGTNCVYKMDFAPNDSWTKMSPDLTDGNTIGSTQGQSFNVISALDNSKPAPALLYAGTSDGNVWRSNDNCATWNNITGTLPDRFVTSVKVSPNDSNLVFVSHSGYRDNEWIPHVHKSLDRGNTWIDISGNLPQLAVNDLLVMPGNDSILFAATDGGVYATIDAGNSWQRLGNNMPVVPVFELGLNTIQRTVFAGTYARSIYSYSLDSLALNMPEDTVISSLHNSEAEVSLAVFPNPANDFLHISTSLKNYSIAIYDLSGRKCLEELNAKNEETIDITALSEGTYVVRMADSKRKITKKFVKLFR